MDKKEWSSFLGAKLKTRIGLETGQRVQTWAFAVAAIFCLGSGFSAASQIVGRNFLLETKVLFCVLAHVFVLLAFYLPNLLERGEKAAARLLCIRNFTSLTLNVLALGLIAAVACMLSFQVAGGLAESEAAGFFVFAAWANAAVSVSYLAGAVLYFVSLAFFPGLMIKAVEKGSRVYYFYFGAHAVLAVLLGMVYSEAVGIGSLTFFEQFRLASLFWIGLGSLLFFVGQALRESVADEISELEFEVTAGRLERDEDILPRYKEAFVSRRLWSWIHRMNHRLASRAHDIAGFTHEAVSLVSQRKPSESDLRKVEECYKKADQVYRRLEKQSQRFTLCSTFFYLTETERERIEALRDEFSKHVRNSKLELVSVRKKIDEKLVALKNAESLPSEAAVEKVPVTGRS